MGKGSSVLLVFEHDLTMDVLLENDLSDIRCCYHSNIYQHLTILVAVTTDPLTY